MGSLWLCGIFILVINRRWSEVEIKIYCILHLKGDRGSTVVKVLCYTYEGRWFDPSWCN